MWNRTLSRLPRGRRLPLRTVAAAAVVLLLLGGAVAAESSSGSSAAPVVTIGEHGCGTVLPRPVAGHQLIDIDDTARDPAQVYLIDPRGGAVYAELTDLLPGATRSLSTTIGAGSYALRCVFSNGVVLTSRSWTVTGSAAGAVPGIQPMPDLALGAPVAAYRAYVGRNLPGLLADSRTLVADVAAGDLARARTDWLTAHLDYERLGAAYNSFGDFDDEINGMASGLPLGTADPSWTGFFRIEFGLWHGQSAAELLPLTKGLVSAVQGLITDFPSEEVDPGDVPLRSHEILENALQFQLTGIADYGSGTTLATLYANTQGTQAVLATITGLITARDPQLLAAIDRGIAAVQGELLADHAADGGWVPPSALPRAQRQQLDGDLGALLENLSSIPDLLTGRTSA